MTPAAPRRRMLQVGLVALALRLGFVAWAPRHVSGDALWYYARGFGISQGWGYVNMSGAPSLSWMPGWPLFLAGLDLVFGHTPLAGMLANALFGAATAALLVPLGVRLFSHGVGGAAAVLYAVWPGNVYYAATLMTETFFNFTFVSALTLLVVGTSRDAKRPGAWTLCAGLAFGTAALVKAEPLVLLPVLVGYLARARGLSGDRLRLVAVFALGTAVVLAPWVVRNWVHFDRLIVTSANGPANAWLGNHAGASGGQDLGALLQYRKKRIADPDVNGYALAWQFARTHPREEAAILWSKLVLTYTADDDAVPLIRGLRVETPKISERAEARLRGVANAFWWVVVALACVGLLTLRAWPANTRWLVLGIPASWLVVHLVFIGGPRFHAPETPAIALAAGAGLVFLRDRWRSRG